MRIVARRGHETQRECARSYCGKGGLWAFWTSFSGNENVLDFAGSRKNFEKIEYFLIDDAAQNAALLEPMRKVIEAGPAVDDVPGAMGEVRAVVTNPIPVNGPVGEFVYPSGWLRFLGRGLFGTAWASRQSGCIRDRQHGREVLGRHSSASITRGKAGRLLPVIGFRMRATVHIHQLHKSPSGRLPLPMEAAIRECMRRLLGLPIRPPNVAELLTSARCRPHA